MILRKLILANLNARRVRTVLTVLAIAFSVSLVVAVTSGYKSAEGAIYKYLVTYMGATDIHINKTEYREGIKETLLDDLRRDVDVARAVGRLEADTGMIDASGKGIAGKAAQLIGVDMPADVDIVRTAVDEGKWFDQASGNVAVIDQQAAEALKVKLGGEILLPGAGGNRKLTVVGICHKPAIFADRVSWIYVPLRTCQELTNRPREVTRILVDLKNKANDLSFAERWKPKLAAIDRDLKMKLSRDTRKEMDKNLQGVSFMSYLGGAASMIVAAFIIFTTLSMGVAERQRTLAMMRAIGAYRSQVAGMVFWEGGYLGLIGGLLGAPLGLLFAWALTAWKADTFAAGLFVSWGGVVFGVVASVVFALMAGALPAWLASRVSPLEAMSMVSRPTSWLVPILGAVLGVALIAYDPFMINYSGAGRDVVFYGHFAIGLPGLFLGFFLLSPVMVWGIEKACSWVVAVAMGIAPAMLRQQLTGGLWRAAGTGSALMMGLAILVGLQTAGHSMLAGWRLPNKFPDIFVWTTNQGLTEQEWKSLDQVEGIRKGQVMPIAIATPGLPEGWMGIVGAAVLPDATMFLGLDPELALDMMDLEFRHGNKEEAKAALRKGGHIVVTDEFRVLKGLKVGDKLPLMTKTGKKDFTICGVVWSPGIDVMVTMFDMGRMFDQRTAASIFGSVEDAKKEFGKDRVYLFAANLQPGADKAEMLKKVKEKVGERGWKAGDVRKIKHDIEKGFGKLLLLMTTVAFAAMAVAALGVMNTVMASVRSRQWQFGILRSIGVTRGQLVRLVLAEAALLGAVGCVLGMGAGFVMAANAMGLSREILGYVTHVTPPWGIIAIGSGIIMVVSLVASLWPASWVAKSEPLRLLQGGRSSG